MSRVGDPIVVETGSAYREANVFQPERQCEAEYHIHLDGKCLAVTLRCQRAWGHRKQDWHRADDPEGGGVDWNFDHRETCPERMAVADRYESFYIAIDQGLIQRRWSCGSDKAECTPLTQREMGYLHDGCRWYFSLWTVDQREIQRFYEMAVDYVEGIPA